MFPATGAIFQCCQICSELEKGRYYNKSYAHIFDTENNTLKDIKVLLFGMMSASFKSPFQTN